MAADDLPMDLKGCSPCSSAWTASEEAEVVRSRAGGGDPARPGDGRVEAEVLRRLARLDDR